MKVYRRSLLLGLMFSIYVLCFVISGSMNTRAKEDLTITNWMINANLLENGDLEVKEVISFEFNDSFNGVYRHLVTNGTDGVEISLVGEKKGSSTLPYQQVKQAKNGDKKVYVIEQDKENALIKLFAPSKNESRTFHLEYIIKNVAVRHIDTGELYYQFIGKDNETPIEHLQIDITIPDTEETGNFHLFAHGPLHGTTNKLSNEKYRLTIENLEPKTWIEARLLFPEHLITLSSKRTNENRYEQILKEEADYQKQIERNLARREVLISVTKWGSLIGLGLSSVLLIISMGVGRRNLRKGNYQGYMAQKELTPALAMLMRPILISDNRVIATLLDLFRKGYLVIEEDKNDKDNYRLILNNPLDSNLHPHERYLISWLFNVIGDGAYVSTDQIKQYGKEKPQEFHKMHVEWHKIIREDAIALGYYDFSKRKWGLFLLIFGIVLLVFSFIGLVMENWVAILSLMASIVTIIRSLFFIFRLSDKGLMLSQSLKEFVKQQRLMLKQDQQVNISQIQLDERMSQQMIYRLAFGLKGSISDMETQSISSTHWLFWYFLFLNTNHSFEKSITQSFAGSSPTSTTTSGGFTIGGGGGAGGGGAGGF